MLLNADKLLKEGIKQVESMGIKPGVISPIVMVNSCSNARFGACRKTSGTYDFQVEISSEILSIEKDKAMDVIVHEILHTVEGCMNHASDWMVNANLMNTELGYNITRTTSYDKLGIVKPNSKYTVKCVDCGFESHYQIKIRMVTHPEEYKCGLCIGELEIV